MKLQKSLKTLIFIAPFILLSSFVLSFQVSELKTDVQPILYNCSGIFPFQTTRIANLIHQAHDKFQNNYADQAQYIKKSVESHFGGGTWEVVITYNVSAKTLDEIQKNIVGHRPSNAEKNLCVFWYAFDQRDPFVVYSVQKVSLINFPASIISTLKYQEYSPFFTYENIQSIKSLATNFCQQSKNLDDFAASFKQSLHGVVASASVWKIVATTVEYNGFAPNTIGEVFSFWFYGFMPKHCAINGKLINIIFWAQ